ncbi:MAG: hypothetical protein LBS56_09030, partial [Propionibacteriaceae bacterium]|nr:hypothetical protein [Propionibacteriaceae bacterium]
MRASPVPLVRAVGLSWTAGLAQLALFLALGHAVDDLAAGRRPGAALYAQLGGAALVAALAAWAGPLFFGREQARDEARTRQALTTHVFALGSAERTRERAGRIVSTATDGVERAAAFRATFLGPMIASTTLPILVLIVLAVTVDAASA